jgi:NitT/TauT family transport system permease protein
VPTGAELPCGSPPDQGRDEALRSLQGVQDIAAETPAVLRARLRRCGVRPSRSRSMKHLRIWQVGLLVVVFVVWHLLTTPGLLPVFMFENDRQAAFFFGEPLKIFARIWAWFVGNHDIYEHLWVTLVETALAFAIGTALGLGCGLWLALSPLAAAITDPYIKALNSMPRVILAPIFSVWFGLGIASKVALGVTLVFFIVFFNVYQGVKEVSPVVLANARMLGANRRQLLKSVYLPSATSWVFSSLHTSVGLAFVGAVVGEYLGSSRGVGYLILQAEGAFDINTVMAGILVLTLFALILDAAVGKLERRLMKWQPVAGETEKL